mmetsp:Transcript_7145/g.8135  ORF Transcript_7145/g.8135 Transcript_7145/m.8135 type:complete len:306 (+) Transcript_7145:629-1546(+)
MRSLFDSEYIQSGCDPLLYDKDENVDNSVGTWSTNYAIFAVGLFFVIKLASCPPFKRNTSLDTGDAKNENLNEAFGDDNKAGIHVENLRKKEKRFSVYLILFFAMMALSFGIAGIQHQIVSTRNSPARILLEVISWLLFHLGNIALLLMLFEMTNVYPRNASTCKQITWYIGIVIGLAVFVLTIVMETLLYAGVLGILLYIATIAVNIMAAAKDGKNIIHYTSKIVGVALLIFGLLVWVTLHPKCGWPEYENCFNECPLPFEFNHNALFHLLFAIGLVVYGWSENISPSVKIVMENMQVKDEFEA